MSVPADVEENTRLIIFEIILDTFRSLDLAYLRPSEAHQRELHLAREQIVN